jgi:hypothetical protein
MSQFTAPLAVSPVDDKFWVILTDTFSYDVGFEGSADRVTVPYGFTTDFASTPSLLWGIMGGPWGKHGNAAVIHDWLYYSQNRPKRDADRIFHEGMKVMGVPPVRAWMMYKAVSWFGKSAWRNNARLAREHPELKMRPDVADIVLHYRDAS